MALTGTFRCNDGGLYYVRELGDEIWWFGEHRGRSFANVFRGQRSAGSFSGRWFDVPKGRAKSSGSIDLNVASGDGGFSRATATGGFGGSQWQFHVELPFPFSTLRAPWSFQVAGFEGSGASDLTGTWMCDDGGTYYVRQIGDDVVWFGEGRRFSNVFFAKRSGSTITGEWADVPKGSILQQGELSLSLEGSFSLARSSGTGGFGGSRWLRVSARDVRVRLDKLVLHETEDWWGDEPFLWTVFVKIDGDTVDLAQLSSATATVISRSGSHKNLTTSEDLDEGTSLSLAPHVGQFRTILKTVRGLDPATSIARSATRFAIIVVAFDEDGTSDGAIEAGRNALVSTLQERLNDAVRNLAPPDEEELKQALKKAVTDAIASATSWYEIGGWSDPDDNIGFQFLNLAFGDLSSGATLPVDMHFTDDDAHYQLTGSVSVTA